MGEPSNPLIRGRLKQPDHVGPGIVVEMFFGNRTIRLTTGGELLGVWPTSGFVFEHVYPGVFHLNVEGEPWVFSTDDPASLIAALPRESLAVETPTDASARRRPTQPSRSPRQILDGLLSSLRRRLRSGVRVAGVAMAILIVFWLGYFIGRSPGRNLALVLVSVILASAVGVSVWSSLDRRRLRAPSPRSSSVTEVRPRPASTTSGTQLFGADVMARRLAEALERVGASSGTRSAESPTDEMTPSSEAHDVTGIESRDRELGEPSLETRREPSHRAGDGTTIEPTRGAIVFLDADGHVIERAPVSSDLDHSSEAGDPDSSSAPSKADTHLEQSSEAEIDTADAPPSPVPADGRASGDDLELIRGIGPVYADALITLGYTTFDSIAALDDEDIERIELLVGPIRRRMEHHRWKEHARSLQRETLGAAGAVEATDRLQHDSTDPQSSQPEPADHPQGRP